MHHAPALHVREGLTQHVPPCTGVEQAKQNLRNRIVGTLRGGAAETLQRGAIEEAQVMIQRFSATTQPLCNATQVGHEPSK